MKASGPTRLTVRVQSETPPLGLLQRLVVFLQNRPGLRSHEAHGGVLALTSHLTHACARDEVIILMTAVEKETREGAVRPKTSSMMTNAVLEVLLTITHEGTLVF